MSDPDQYLSDAFIKSLHAQVVELKGDVAACTEATQRNAEAVTRVETNTRDIVDLFQSLEGGFKVLQGLGKFMRVIGWFAAGAASVLAFVAAIKGLRK